MCRDPPEPITGFDAATSGVKITVPTVEGIDRSVFMEKSSKFVWFKMLKNSPRNCRCTLSRNRKAFEMEKSQFLNEGPRKIFRPILPCEPYAGGVITVFLTT